MGSAIRSAAVIGLFLTASLAAQQPVPTTASQAPNSDTSYIDAQGTAHITRVIPVPATISPEAQQWVAQAAPDQAPPESLADRRARTDAYTALARIAWTKLCPNQIVDDKIAGVPVRIVTPPETPPIIATWSSSTCMAAASIPILAPTANPSPSRAMPRSRLWPCSTALRRRIPFPRASTTQSPSTKSC